MILNTWSHSVSKQKMDHFTFDAMEVSEFFHFITSIGVVAFVKTAIMHFHFKIIKMLEKIYKKMLINIK